VDRGPPAAGRPGSPRAARAATRTDPARPADLEQITEAQIELDRRYLDSLGFDGDHFLRRLTPLGYSLDPAELALIFHPDLEYVEHRALTFEGGDFDAHVVIPQFHRLSERGAVWEKREVATSGEGESRLLIVATYSDDLVRTIDLFEVDELDTALTKHHELTELSA
jgi:hypothetical protein